MRTVPNIPPPTPAGISKPGLRYPAPPLQLTGRAAEVLRELRAADTSATALGMRRPAAPTAPVPLELTDWSARIAADWKDVDARLNRLHVRIAAEQVGMERSHAVAVCMLTAPLFAELADFAAELDDDRAAMSADLNAERALSYDALVRKAGAEL